MNTITEKVSPAKWYYSMLEKKKWKKSSRIFSFWLWWVLFFQSDDYSWPERFIFFFNWRWREKWKYCIFYFSGSIFRNSEKFVVRLCLENPRKKISQRHFKKLFKSKVKFFLELIIYSLYLNDFLEYIGLRIFNLEISRKKISPRNFKTFFVKLGHIFLWNSSYVAYICGICKVM